MTCNTCNDRGFINGWSESNIAISLGCPERCKAFKKWKKVRAIKEEANPPNDM